MKSKAMVILGIAALLVSGCATSNSLVTASNEQPGAGAPYSVRGWTPSGRDVRASGDVVLAITVQDDGTVMLIFDNHILTVKKDQVLLDGTVRAKISPSARSIQVTCTNHNIFLIADNKRVLNTKYE